MENNGTKEKKQQYYGQNYGIKPRTMELQYCGKLPKIYKEKNMFHVQICYMFKISF